MMKLHSYHRQAKYKIQLYAKRLDEGDWTSTWKAEGKMALAPFGRSGSKHYLWLSLATYC